MKEKNFKFRANFGRLVSNMTDKQAGEFIKAVSGYIFENKPMESKDEYLKGVFLYVKNVLDTDVQNRENGRLGGAITAQKMRNKTNAEKQKNGKGDIVSQLIFVNKQESTRVTIPSENKQGAKSASTEPAAKCSNENRRNARVENR